MMNKILHKFKRSKIQKKKTHLYKDNELNAAGSEGDSGGSEK